MYDYIYCQTRTLKKKQNRKYRKHAISVNMVNLMITLAKQIVNYTIILLQFSNVKIFINTS